MKPNPPTHGGKRANAGRKPAGKPPAVSRSVSMLETEWNALDAAREGKPRGVFIAAKLGLHRPKIIYPKP
jgi:hypothetical protein